MTFLIRTNVTMLDLSQFLPWVLEENFNEYFGVAMTTALVYHTITTLDKEVKYFWGAQLNSVTVAYFANRYVGILGMILYLIRYIHIAPTFFFVRDAALKALMDLFITIGSLSIWASNFAICTTLILIDYILLIRVLALYSQAKYLAYFLKALLGLEAILELVILVYLILGQDVTIFDLSPNGPTLCRVRDYSPLVVPLGIVFWAILLVYGVILMSLSLYKAAEFWKISGGFKGFNLVKVLIIDQLLYFLAVIACCAMKIASTKIIFSNIFLASLIGTLSSPIYLCIMGSILLFNLKEAGERGFNQGTSYRLKSVSAMEFA